MPVGRALATQILWTENFVDVSISLMWEAPAKSDRSGHIISATRKKERNEGLHWLGASLVEASPSYKPKMRKQLISLKKDKKETFSSFCKETQKWPKGDFWGPLGVKMSVLSHFLVTFESLYKKRTKSLLSQIKYFLILGL